MAWRASSFLGMSRIVSPLPVLVHEAVVKKAHGPAVAQDHRILKQGEGVLLAGLDLPQQLLALARQLLQPPLAQDLVHGIGVLLLQSLQIGNALGYIHPVTAGAAPQQHRRRQRPGRQRRFSLSCHVWKTAFRKIKVFFA